MRIVMTLCVRDEEDVLDAHLRHHLDNGVDFFVVTDNLSTDRTPEILDAYASRGLAHVIREPADDFAQGRWVTRMARLAHSELGADWVLHADADEFFHADGASIRDALAAVPDDYGIVAIPRVNFRPRPDDGRPFHQRLTVREADHARERPLFPKEGHRAHPDAVVGLGNHRIDGTGLVRFPGRPIEILHFPMRSYAQFERRVRDGVAAIERNPDYGPHTMRRWRWYHDLLTSGRLQDYYESQVVDDRALDAGLRDGDLIVDDRLARRFARAGWS